MESQASYDLSGVVAVVTGGGRGIGRAIALALAVATDLTSSEQIEALVEATIGECGRIDILVTNAATSHLVPLLEFKEKHWDRIFDTNCKGPLLLSRAAARRMIDQGGGKIVNITTVGAERGGVGMGVYNASKPALKMLTMCMAAEWDPHNICINAVGPGLTRTEFSRPLWSETERAGKYLSAVPKGRVAEPEEIVGAVLFLSSSASDFVAGQSMYVDGGYLAA